MAEIPMSPALILYLLQVTSNLSIIRCETHIRVPLFATNSDFSHAGPEWARKLNGQTGAQNYFEPGIKLDTSAPRID
jgi:hypothetical protein